MLLAEFNPMADGGKIISRHIDLQFGSRQLIFPTDSIMYSRGIQQRDRPMARCPQVEIIVFAAMFQLGIEMARGSQSFPREQRS